MRRTLNWLVGLAGPGSRAGVSGHWSLARLDWSAAKTSMFGVPTTVELQPTKSAGQNRKTTENRTVNH